MANYTSEHTGKALDYSAGHSLEGTSTTLLAQVQALGTSGGTVQRAQFYTKTDGGSANITDKPTGSSSAGFVCFVSQNRYNGTNDYRYILECYVQSDTNPYVAVVTQATTALSWSRLNTTYSTTTAVTSGSTALVTSGGVYSAIESAITTALNTSV